LISCAQLTNQQRVAALAHALAAVLLVVGIVWQGTDYSALGLWAFGASLCIARPWAGASHSAAPFQHTRARVWLSDALWFTWRWA